MRAFSTIFLLFFFLSAFSQNSDVYESDGYWACKMTTKSLNWEKDGCSKTEVPAKFDLSRRGAVIYSQDIKTDVYMIIDEYEGDKGHVIVTRGDGGGKWKFVINEERGEMMVTNSSSDGVLIFEIEGK